MQDRTAFPTPETIAGRAAASFLGFYRGNTREAYTLDLRLLFDWCAARDLDPLAVTRLDLEAFALHLELDRHNSPATIHRRIGTVGHFYSLATADDLIPRSPVVRVRLPKLQHDDRHLAGLTHLQMSALADAARRSTPSDWALVTLMMMLGLRVSEACSIQVRDIYVIERGHRVISFIGKGSKPATMPLAIPVARALDAAAGDRTTGPLLLRRDGSAMNRRSAARVVARLAAQAGITAHVHPHMLRHAFITACLDAGANLRDTQYAARHSDPRMTTRYDDQRRNLDRHPGYLLASFMSNAA